MNEKKKAKGTIILRLLLLLFIIYLSLTIAMNTGYYEAKLSERATITATSMKRFENDIKAGKDVDIKDYLEQETKDYSNLATRAGVALSKAAEDFMSEGITKAIDILKKLFT